MKSKSAILAAAGGSHEAAFEALYADYANSIKANSDLQEQLDNAGNDGGSLRNRVIAKALAPLAEAVGIELPAPGQKPAKDAEQVIGEQVQAVIQGLDDLETGHEAALTLLANAGLDLEATEGENGESVIEAWLSRIGESDTLREMLTLNRAATALGVPEAELTEWLGGRTLTSGKAKDAEGKDVDTFGLSVKGEDGKDVFKSLTEFATFQKLAQSSQQQQQQTPRWVQQPDSQPQALSADQLKAQMAASGAYAL